MSVESSSAIELRKRSLQFAKYCCENLNLQLRSRELVYILIDACLIGLDYTVREDKLLIITCIVFVIKLESDFTDQLATFIQACEIHLNMSMADIMRNETLILKLMPDCFCVMPTVTEAVEAIAAMSEVDLSLLGVSIDVLKDAALQSYIQERVTLSIFDLCFLPLILQLPSAKLKNQVVNQAILLYEWLRIETTDYLDSE